MGVRAVVGLDDGGGLVMEDVVMKYRDFPLNEHFYFVHDSGLKGIAERCFFKKQFNSGIGFDECAECGPIYLEHELVKVGFDFNAPVRPCYPDNERRKIEGTE